MKRPTWLHASDRRQSLKVCVAEFVRIRKCFAEPGVQPRARILTNSATPRRNAQLQSRQSADRRFGPRLSAVTLLWLLLAASIVVALPGCRGCWNEDPLARLRREEDEEKKKREKPKPDFEVSRPQIVPFDSGSKQLQFVKHGHWMGAVQPVKANNFDFQAEIESTCARTGGEAIEIPNTAYRLQTWRPAALPKGQQKLVETTHFWSRRRGRRTLWARCLASTWKPGCGPGTADAR
jgi:hypothetical protein